MKINFFLYEFFLLNKNKISKKMNLKFKKQQKGIYIDL